MPASRPRTAEDDEFDEANAILAELRRRAASGESDLPWGECAERGWSEDGVLHVTREYEVPGGAGLERLRIREFPYAAHPRPGAGSSTGGVVWAGALALSELLRDDGPSWAAAAHACESWRSARAAVCRGSLVAAALAGGGAEVALTDGDEAPLDNLRHNVAVNADRIAAHVRVAHLVWEEVLDGRAVPPMEEVDLLLGSDVIWGERGPLVGRLALRLVRPGGRLVITAETGREGLNAFESVVADARGSQAADSPGGPMFDVDTCSATAAGETFVHYV
eukprot:CAMPEP_0175506492 /NCGR_PEP_ID=MMETSP0096-20121207/9379_1 /TAXON_ID=311494 /ORGANISM="Alexandrium monilatum, Strain CCMP3105" /LENGTH=277 /DNA_ID=CAMNT_0016808595 /DNA_START=3 /DNA_END=834 /DNA_ORIENTATION=+